LSAAGRKTEYLHELAEQRPAIPGFRRIDSTQLQSLAEAEAMAGPNAPRDVVAQLADRLTRLRRQRRPDAPPPPHAGERREEARPETGTGSREESDRRGEAELVTSGGDQVINPRPTRTPSKKRQRSSPTTANRPAERRTPPASPRTPPFSRRSTLSGRRGAMTLNEKSRLFAATFRVGAPGFEPGTSSPPDWRANQAAPRPVLGQR
jgi:hypothetical protein